MSERLIYEFPSSILENIGPNRGRGWEIGLSEWATNLHSSFTDSTLVMSAQIGVYLY